MFHCTDWDRYLHQQIKLNHTRSSSYSSLCNATTTTTTSTILHHINPTFSDNNPYHQALLLWNKSYSTKSRCGEIWICSFEHIQMLGVYPPGIHKVLVPNNKPPRVRTSFIFFHPLRVRHHCSPWWWTLLTRLDTFTSSTAPLPQTVVTMLLQQTPILCPPSISGNTTSPPPCLKPSPNKESDFLVVEEKRRWYPSNNHKVMKAWTTNRLRAC